MATKKSHTNPETHLTYLVNERLNMLEDVIKHAGPSDACWLIDSKKIMELKNTMSQSNSTAVMEFEERLRKVEKRLKDCYNYR